MKHLVVLSVVAAVLLTGCGYQIGYLGHPQIKTVGVAPVSNDTLMYNLAPQLRAMLCECFQTDGSLKLVDEKEADCIVYARVVGNPQFSVISWSTTGDDYDDKFQPNQWRVSVDFEYSVFLPGRAEPLKKPTRCTGSCEFGAGADVEASRTNAVRQACYAGARQIVTGLVEAW